MQNYTDLIDFYKGNDPRALVQQYGSPLYVYNEDIFRTRCRAMKNLVQYPHFKVNFSVKANTNLTLLRIAKEEGLCVDAMSPGEIYMEEQAGFASEDILFISNNVSEEEMMFAVSRGIMVSVDSLSQLEMFGRLCPGGRICARLNSGVGAGHHENVVTGGEKTKFAIYPGLLDEMRAILAKYDLHLVGVNQHIGSHFMEGEEYIQGVKALLAIAGTFPELEFIDMGGGFGTPYNKLDGEQPLDLTALGQMLDPILADFAREYGREVLFKVEPGRYLTAECSVLLGTVHAIKESYGRRYAGTDIGFNVLVRPVMYDAHHDIEVYSQNPSADDTTEHISIVGNICESGDVLARSRDLPPICEKDIIGVLDAGAYGYSMCSNYNSRLRPAEVLITSDGSHRLIRRRDTLEDLMRNFEF